MVILLLNVLGFGGTYMGLLIPCRFEIIYRVGVCWDYLVPKSPKKKSYMLVS